MINLQPAANLLLINSQINSQTFGDILCCKCGTPTPPNFANMCKSCLDLETQITLALPTRVSIIHSPECRSYLQQPTTWLKAERESKELLTFCLKRVKKLSEFRFVDAKFQRTESHSKRINLQLKVLKEVLDRVYVEKTHDIEFVEIHQKCRACLPFNSIDQWEAVVQARQHVAHMRTFHHLEHLIVKYNALTTAVKLKQVPQGIDFFFAKKQDAVKFFEFMCSVAPIKPQNKFHKKLMSQDTKSNISRYRFSIVAVISTICRNDLIYQSRFGQLGSLVICTKVRNTITLLDPFTLKHCVISSDQYWREPFDPLLSSKQLVEYVVLDVVTVSSENDNRGPRYKLADVEIARVSDFGKNDRIISTRTHLGHLLKPGDYALGYDLCSVNFNNSEAEERKSLFPDAVLIKQKSSENCQRKTSEKRTNNDSEYQQFLKDLEVNPELRFNLYLHKDARKVESSPEMVCTEAGVDAGSFNQLEDVFPDLDLSDDDDEY